MALSLAERAIQEIVRRLKTIQTPAFDSDIGDNVLRAKRNLDVKQLPAVVVWDTGSEAGTQRADGTTSAFDITQNISVEIHAIPASAATLTELGADVKRAVMSNKKLADASGDIGGITWTGSVFDAKDAGGQTEVMTVTFSLFWREAYGNPTSSQRLNINT